MESRQEEVPRSYPRFERDSAIWQVSREAVILLSGPAASILQAAHPVVAAGVKRHSAYARDPLGRLERTLDAVYTLVFGTEEEARAMAEWVAKRHRAVRGKEPVNYNAFDPDAQLWVLATLIFGALGVYEDVFGALKSKVREEYYQQMRLFGTWFGLPEEKIPDTLAGMEAYYREMFSSELLVSDSSSVEIARTILHPVQPWYLRWGMKPVAWVFPAYIPEPVRGKLELKWTGWQETGFRVLRRVLRVVVPLLPASLRYVAHYRRAEALQK